MSNRKLERLKRAKKRKKMIHTFIAVLIIFCACYIKINPMDKGRATESEAVSQIEEIQQTEEVLEEIEDPTVVEFVSLASIMALATQATYGIGYKHGINNNLLEDGRRLFLDYLAESARKNPDGKVIKITNEVTDEVAYLVTKFVTEKPEAFNDNDLTKLA